ncbi:MAG: hypothetical protein AAGA35_02905 [Patescibacteria group bacterium]
MKHMTRAAALLLAFVVTACGQTHSVGIKQTKVVQSDGSTITECTGTPELLKKAKQQGLCP